MSPDSSCFSFETSLTTSPVRTVELLHLGSSRVAETTYLGRLFSLSAHSPPRDSHRAANHSSLRRPSSRASVPSASPSKTLAHSSRSLPPNWPNQPPSLKPSLPSGSWTTPSSEAFVLMTIFPMSVLLCWRCRLPLIQTPRRQETGRSSTAPFAPRPASIQDGSATRCRREVARVEVARAGLISRARAGDGEAFRALTEPYRRELQVHCYRMLGSFQDAEDALQDTLLAAWRGLGGFDGRASLRTWLYRIATNRCLNALRSARRRPAKQWDIPGIEPPEPTGLGEIHWLEPYPDALLDGAISVPLGPEARYEQTESISLAFVTALQILPPRQLSVLILRDVLGFHANEVADMLDTTVESVKSALKRARAGMQRRLPVTSAREQPPASDSPAEDAIVAKFVSAYESADIDALVALFTDDVF